MGIYRVGRTPRLWTIRPNYQSEGPVPDMLLAGAESSMRLVRDVFVSGQMSIHIPKWYMYGSKLKWVTGAPDSPDVDFAMLVVFYAEHDWLNCNRPIDAMEDCMRSSTQVKMMAHVLKSIAVNKIAEVN